MDKFLTGVAVSGGVLVGLVLIVATLLLGAWPLMLIIGALHSVWPAIPALGYWFVVLGLVVLRLVGSLLRWAVS